MGGQFYGPIQLNGFSDRFGSAAIIEAQIPISGRTGRTGFVGSAWPEWALQTGEPVHRNKVLLTLAFF